VAVKRTCFLDGLSDDLRLPGLLERGDWVAASPFVLWCGSGIESGGRESLGHCLRAGRARVDAILTDQPGGTGVRDGETVLCSRRLERRAEPAEA